jgi:hypothetical protein
MMLLAIAFNYVFAALFVMRFIDSHTTLITIYSKSYLFYMFHSISTLLYVKE